MFIRKNGTTYGEVKIVKTGRVGSGTPSKLSGVTFTLEKWNETDGKWNLVTASDKDGKEFNLTTDTNGENFRKRPVSGQVSLYRAVD